MKVLMIATEKLPVPPVRGGAIQTYIAGVAPLLAKHHDVTVLGIADPLLPKQEVKDGVRYVRVPGGDLGTYRSAVEAYLASHSDYDLIHLFNRPRLVDSVRKAVPLARLVLSMHNEMFGPNKLEPQAAAQVIRETERIVTISNYIGRTIAGLFPEATPKLRTIYSGVDLKRFAPPDSSEARRAREQLRQQHKLGSRRVVLFVGRLSPSKGADILIRAMQALPSARQRDTALVLVGSKWYSTDKVSDYVAYVRALAARSKMPIISTGYVTADQVHKWFHAGDVFVCPSQWEEPLARVHYEAMAAGLPIITTSRGGNPEVIIEGENGLIVNRPKEPEAFTQIISRLLADSRLAKQMGQRGRAIAEQRYGWDRVAKEILEVWG